MSIGNAVHVKYMTVFASHSRTVFSDKYTAAHECAGEIIRCTLKDR